jgi:hypothetical protein
MTPTSHIIQNKKAVKDDCHRLKLYERQKLWEGRYVTKENKQPVMLKVVIFTKEAK